MFSLDGQVAIITGGAQGIGEGICKVFSKAGATVALWDVRDSGETTAETIKKEVDFVGEIVWDSSKPDGTPRKLMDVGKLHAAGWKHKIDLKEGISLAYKDFQEKYSAYTNG